MYRCRPWPTSTERIRACSCGGGGAFDQDRHQRCSVTQGVSQARTRRSARGHEAGWCVGVVDPPLSAGGTRLRSIRILLRIGRRVVLPGEAERAVDQGLMSPDGGVGAYLEVRPAQFVFDLLVALLDPVADTVDPHHLGNIRRCTPAAWARRTSAAPICSFVRNAGSFLPLSKCFAGVYGSACSG